MCYSASASFTASLALTLMSSIMISRGPAKKNYLIVLVPFFFALQQFAEGLVWLEYYPLVAKDVFLFFAYVFWPIYIPLAFYILETHAKRKLALAITFGIGITSAIILGLTIPGVTPKFLDHSIHYAHSFQNGPALSLSYLFALIAPFFITSHKYFWIYGILGLISAIAIALIDQYLFVSLWCFLAALLSLGLFFFPSTKSAE